VCVDRRGKACLAPTTDRYFAMEEQTFLSVIDSQTRMSDLLKLRGERSILPLFQRGAGGICFNPPLSPLKIKGCAVLKKVDRK